MTSTDDALISADALPPTASPSDFVLSCVTTATSVVLSTFSVISSLTAPT
jgi:hypothetical protein